ncbi:hypothetical protein FHE72_23400 (plasmid) [Rossellomorea vietnamensis]|uniref:Uncharacterized protein n=1 Tax=Rossellomorea vietnamensis TaxID=218284 RepID=A0A6I6UY47_9BACI|nr:hypothetical protein FHE72_23400 [Rossellomorea vietnamensis]
MKNIAIKKCKKINPHHKQIADIYDLFDRRNESRINRIDFNREMDEIRNSTVSRSETKLLLNIGKLYYYSDSGNYRGILDEESYMDTNVLRSEYLATSLRLRILERKATALIKYENDLVQATKILEEILQKGDDFAFSLINALSLMSEVHLMKDFDLSAGFIRKAIKLCEKISQDNKRYLLQKRQLESTHDFIMLYHCRLNEELYLNSKPELIHFLIRRGSEEDLARATSLLKELEKENGKLTPFQLYYKALITGEKHYLIKSQREFHRAGDFFYSQIPSKLL